MYECKVFSPTGKLTKVYSVKEVKKHFDKQLEPKKMNTSINTKGDVGSRNIPGNDYECVCVICGKEFKGLKPNAAACNFICEKKRRSQYQKDRYQKIKAGEVTVKKGKRRGVPKTIKREAIEIES